MSFASPKKQPLLPKQRPGKVVCLLDFNAHYAFKLMLETLRDEGLRDHTLPESFIYPDTASFLNQALDVGTGQVIEPGVIALCATDENSFEGIRIVSNHLKQSNLSMNFKVIIFDYMLDSPAKSQLSNLASENGHYVFSAHGQSTKLQRLTLERQTKIFYALRTQINSNEFNIYLEQTRPLPVGFRFQWKPELPFAAYDPWITPSQQFIHFEKDRWIILLLGPQDIAGKWRKLGKDLKSNEVWWVWMPILKTELLAGKWLFRGLKPQYQHGIWVMIGFQPELTFLYPDKVRHQRIRKNEYHSFEVLQNNSGTELKYPEVIKNINNTLAGKGPPEADKNAIFKKMHDSEEIDHVLETAAKNQKEVFIWFKGMSSRVSAKIINHTVINGKDQLLIESDQLLKDFSSNPKAKIMGNFNLRRGAVFFNLTGADAVGNNGLIIKPDRIFFEVQRRRSPRIPITVEMPVKIRLNQSERVIKDMSVTGVCVYLLDRDEETSIIVGKVCAIQLEIATHILHLKAYVRWVRDISGRPAIGLEYFDVSSTNSIFLQTSIFELGSNDAEEDG